MNAEGATYAEDRTFPFRKVRRADCESQESRTPSFFTLPPFHLYGSTLRTVKRQQLLTF